MISIILLLLTFIHPVFNDFNNSRDLSDYCYGINSMVKTYDFAYGYIDGEYIALYDNSKTKTAEIAVNDSLSDGNYLYFYKTGENLRFVTSRKADDETGIMIVNDESDRIFDGLWSIKRVSGNSYYYNTQP